MQERAFLIFSGHNDRAVLALCRFFSQRQLPFVIAASTEQDYIFQTPWADRVKMVRGDKTVNISLFQTICHTLPNTALIYCPTTEYINHFILSYRPALEALGLEFLLPSSNIYQCLSNKASSLEFIQTLGQLQAPRHIPWGEITSPCVFKPKENISAGTVHYPLLCFSDIEAQEKYTSLNPEHWFVQQYVQGQSHYLCAYLSPTGSYASYWQTNWVQQPDGKSIVLAKIGKNPGLDEPAFFHHLWQHQYHGPLMMEVLEDAKGQLFYIEINPRFWGPLQLAVDACPRLLDLFAWDAGFSYGTTPFPPPPEQDFWYAWAAGAQTPGYRIYPAAQHLQNTELQSLLAQFDVFNSQRNWN